jgi:hypothetical protein
MVSLESQSGAPYWSIPLKRRREHEAELAELNRLFPGAEAAIRKALNDYVDKWLVQYQNMPKAAFSSSWVPGPDWNKGSGVYQPIFDTMLDLYVDEDLAHKRAGWFFGLILMGVMIQRDTDHWECWHETAELDEDPLGMFYRPLRRSSAGA